MRKSQSATASYLDDAPVAKEANSKQSWLWSGINIVMAIFFALAAYVQVSFARTAGILPMDKKRSKTR